MRVKPEEFVEALRALVEVCEQCATFDNGVYAPDGRNEGDYWASQALDEARRLLREVDVFRG